MPLCSLARRLRARRASSRNGSGQQDINEKQTPQRRNQVNISAAVLRLLQCLSAWSVYATLSVLFQSLTSGAPFGDDSSRAPPAYIRKLTSSDVLYHCSVLVFIGLLRRAKTSVTWRVFAVGTILLDLVMMLFAITNISVMSVIALATSCQASTSKHSFGTLDLRQLVTDYSRSVFGGHGNSGTAEKMEFLCTVPRVVYVLSIISIFSHTLSIVLTVLQFQQNKAQRKAETMGFAGHVEEAVPEVIYNRPNIQVQPLMPQPVQQAEMYQQRPNHVADPRFQTPAPTRPSDLHQQYPGARYHWENPSRATANPPTEEFTNPPGWRSSQETTSSFNPDLYLVSDGFRPLPSPPAYTSRPSSLFDIRT
ncbi:hypothetical protein QBC37DRAFT_367407 [Rhypophila decipiens]|uniref:Uncharacterized protein n=1 Tax=Rhypophila decipiens TaxID=261697 RepID=A0AAN6YIA6_9PEZI|nr:hypothetical protein QBC37DRAFT_367407 [Rhypophila decipiens]